MCVGKNVGGEIGMAFAGLFIAGVVIAILGAIVGLGLIFFIAGIILRFKKKKKASHVFMILGGVNIIGVIIFVVYLIMPKSTKVETPTGYAKIKPSWQKQYNKCLDNHDVDGLRKLVNDHPELVYFYDNNRVMLLDYGLYNCDIDIMQIALDNGAIFDEPLRYDHMSFFSSLDSFFLELDYPSWERDVSELTIDGETTDEMLSALEFAINNGAAVRWDVNHEDLTDNFYDEVLSWVEIDGQVSDKDNELLKMVEAADTMK
jgi:hypothetical protein